MSLAIPTINLSHDGSATVAALKEACEKIGFFYLEGHGISDELMSRTFAASAALFHLPPEEKRRLLADSNNRGYTNLGEEVLDPSGPKEGEHKEGYYIGREVDPSSPEAELPLHGPNQWPDEAVLLGWRDTMTEYFEACHAVGVRVIALLAQSLGLPPDHFQAPGFFDKPQLFLRLLRYGPCASAADGALHAGGHTDYGMITLLATDENPGLQVLWRGAGGGGASAATGEWVDVPPRPGAFIVNLGDMCEVFANGTYVSTMHRVVMSNGKERFSIPFFMEPNYTCVVKPLDCCVTAERPAKYEPVQAGKWLLGKYKDTHKDYKVPGEAL